MVDFSPLRKCKTLELIIKINHLRLKPARPNICLVHLAGGV